MGRTVAPQGPTQRYESRSAAFQRAAAKPSTVTNPKKNKKTTVAAILRWSNIISPSTISNTIRSENRQRGDRHQQQQEPVEERNAEQERFCRVVKRRPQRQKTRRQAIGLVSYSPRVSSRTLAALPMRFSRPAYRNSPARVERQSSTGVQRFSLPAVLSRIGPSC